MNDNQLESYLRENKPRPEQDPTFILETRRRMAEVEGIKSEVDRTRHTGRSALIIALVVGIAIGVSAAALAYLFPVKPEFDGIGWVANLRVWLQANRQYLLLPVAALITALALVLTRRREASRA